MHRLVGMGRSAIDSSDQNRSVVFPPGFSVSVFDGYSSKQTAGDRQATRFREAGKSFPLAPTAIIVLGIRRMAFASGWFREFTSGLFKFLRGGRLAAIVR